MNIMSVSEYNIKIENLSCYAPHLILIDDDKINRLAHGQLPSIRRRYDKTNFFVTWNLYILLFLEEYNYEYLFLVKDWISQSSLAEVKSISLSGFVLFWCIYIDMVGI